MRYARHDEARFLEETRSLMAYLRENRPTRELSMLIKKEEAALFRLYLIGRSSHEIAQELNISETQVDLFKVRLRYRIEKVLLAASPKHPVSKGFVTTSSGSEEIRPPFNGEYLLYLFLKREEREEVIGDLIESYGRVVRRFGLRRANIWFYKQVAGSLFPLARRALLRIGTLVWLGRFLRRLIS